MHLQGAAPQGEGGRGILKHQSKINKRKSDFTPQKAFQPLLYAIKER
jgi:hypothetical protein